MFVIIESVVADLVFGAVCSIDVISIRIVEFVGFEGDEFLFGVVCLYNPVELI